MSLSKEFKKLNQTIEEKRLIRTIVWEITPGFVKRFTDLLSIVVPAYNVERYLGECLDSILAQKYKWLEVIIVVDGATDDTYDIAKAYAAQDKRVRVHYQENAGLSAARNAGAAQAKGKYLWFIDSDDKVPRKAADHMIRSLKRTGSDFAVGCYNRFHSTKSWNGGAWVLDVHSAARPKVTLNEFPDILVNAVAWSKVYRRGFWERTGLSFPVGVTYEDQPVSARAYACARAFDVLPQFIYNWRDREDQSSISQQSREIADLENRFDAAKNSLAILRQSASCEVATERAVHLLANDMQHSMWHWVNWTPWSRPFTSEFKIEATTCW